MPAKLLARADRVGLSLLFGWKIGWGAVFVFGTTARRGNQPDIPHLNHHLLPAIHPDAHLRRQFRLRRIALQDGSQVARGRLDLLMPPPHVTGGPIELAKAVKNRALDAVLRVTRKIHPLARVV